MQWMLQGRCFLAECTWRDNKPDTDAVNRTYRCSKLHMGVPLNAWLIAPDSVISVSAGQQDNTWE